MRRVAILLGILAAAGCEQAPGTPADPDANTQETDAAEVEAESSAALQKQPPMAPAGSSCAGNGNTVFTCRTATDHRLSVCLAGGRVEYLYNGSNGRIRLSGGEYAQRPYSGGSEAQIRFSNAQFDYIVFSRMIRTNFEPGEPNEPAISDGVVVLADGEFRALIQCDPSDAAMISIDYAKAENQLPRRDELFTDQTYRADAYQ